QATRKGIEHYLEAGRALIRAREECKRRGLPFSRWIEENLRIKRRRAYQIIDLAECAVTAQPDDLPEHWRRISGNAAPVVNVAPTPGVFYESRAPDLIAECEAQEALDERRDEDEVEQLDDDDGDEQPPAQARDERRLADLLARATGPEKSDLWDVVIGN